MIDKSKATVTMTLEDYEYYSKAEQGLCELMKMFERANKNGTAVMTDELKKAIEEIHC